MGLGEMGQERPLHCEKQSQDTRSPMASLITLDESVDYGVVSGIRTLKCTS